MWVFDLWIRKIPPGGGHGNPVQYSRLENPMDRRAWGATVHRVAESWTRLSTHACWIQCREKKAEGKHSQTHTPQWPSTNGRA